MATANLNMVSARGPSKLSPTPSSWQAPSQQWLCRTWTVTHSTLKSWSSGAKNCRITYSPASPASDGRLKVTATQKMEVKGSLKTSTTTCTAAKKGNCPGEWESKGKLLKGSGGWEILGWGDITAAVGEKGSGEVVESWMIVYTPDGVNVMSSRKQGMGSETAERCLAALKRLPDGAAKVRNAVVMNLRVLDVGGTWKE